MLKEARNRILIETKFYLQLVKYLTKYFKIAQGRGQTKD